MIKILVVVSVTVYLLVALALADTEINKTVAEVNEAIDYAVEAERAKIEHVAALKLCASKLTAAEEEAELSKFWL